jgi:hypothetical protein
MAAGGALAAGSRRHRAKKVATALAAPASSQVQEAAA